jgi:hypothetical protein
MTRRRQAALKWVPLQAVPAAKKKGSGTRTNEAGRPFERRLGLGRGGCRRLWFSRGRVIDCANYNRVAVLSGRKADDRASGTVNMSRPPSGVAVAAAIEGVALKEGQQAKPARVRDRARGGRAAGRFARPLGPSSQHSRASTATQRREGRTSRHQPRAAEALATRAPTPEALLLRACCKGSGALGSLLLLDERLVPLRDLRPRRARWRP